MATATTYSTNLERLKAAQKPSRGTAAYSRYVNRPLGRVVAASVHTIGMTPNVATLVSALLSASGIVILALVRPSWLMGAAVAVLLAAGYVMDSVDGQLARLRSQRSVRGEWLDHTVDCVKTSSLHVAVAVSWFRFPPVAARAALLVPLVFAVVAAVTYFGLILMPFLRQKAAIPAAERSAAPPSPEGPWRKWLILPTDYGFLCWTFVLMGAAHVFFGVYLALAVLCTLMLAAALSKWWRELGAIDAQAARPSVPSA